MASSTYRDTDRYNLPERLHELRLKDRHRAVVQGLLYSVAVMLLIIAAISGMEALLRLPPGGRLFLVGVGALSLVFVLLWRSGMPLIRRVSDDELARRVDRRFPHLNDQVTLTLQLARQRENQTSPYSADLLDAAVRAGADVTRETPFLEASDRRRLRYAGQALALSFAFSSVVFALFYSPLSDAAYRLAHPLTDFPVPQKTFLSVTPGDAEIPLGAEVSIEARISGETPEATLLHLYDGAGKVQSFVMNPSDASTCSHRLSDVRETIAYEVEAGDALSPRYYISLIDYPTIAALSLTYAYPAYTRMPARATADGNGDVTGLKGTRITVDVESTQPLAAAYIERPSQPAPLRMTVDGHKASAVLAIVTDEDYRIILQNREGRASMDPPAYRITALPDRMPEVDIVSPGKDTNLTENMMIPLEISAMDDYGFSSISLVAQKNMDGEPTRKALPFDRTEMALSTSYVWDLTGLELLPEDVVSYYVESYDNDTVSGPKRAVSQTYTVRFPSIAEIYEQIDRQQDQQVADFEDMLKVQEETQEKLEKLDRELDQENVGGAEGNRKELSWEQKKEIESLIERQEKMADDVLKAAEAVEQSLQQLSEQDMKSLDLLEKMNELRKMFQEIATPELMKAIKELREAMKSLDRQELKESMKDFAVEQEEFMKRLERSLSILKRMRAEQQMTAAVRKAEELVKRQEELQYATQKTTPQSSAQERQTLADKQSELSKEADALKKDLNDLARSMEELQNFPSEEVRSVAENMERQGLTPQMNRISQQLASGQMSTASQGQQQVSENLSEMAQSLQAIEDQMQQDQKQEIAEEMRRAMHDLLKLSHNQETLKNRTDQPAGRNARTQDLAEDQQGLLKGASRIADELVSTSQKSFFISPEIGKSLGETLNRMQSASADLSQRNRGTATRQQLEAMQSLNQTVLALRQAMNQLNASGSSSGMMEMLQQLQSMAQQQSGINDELSQMMDQGERSGESGDKKMSMEERARMSRLASEQEALRKSLEQLQKEHQQTQARGSLGEIEREMEETVRALQHQQVDNQLIERQQRILSRLLDASRSMRERDFDEKRQAKAGEESDGRVAPAELPAGLLEIDRTLRDDLLRSVRDGSYPQEYEDLIRAYFRALSDAPREKK